MQFERSLNSRLLAQPLQILIVDPDLPARRLIRLILQSEGHLFHEALDGEEAIAQFETIRPDLVLLNMVLPRLSGLKVLAELRQRDPLAGIIMASALPSEHLAVESLLGGADDYLAKPFRLRAIQMSVRRVMERVQLRRQIADLQSKMLSANQRLRQYVAQPLVESLLRSPTPPQLGGVRISVTTLFLDFADFTELADELSPDQVVQLLNTQFAFLTEIVLANGGFVDKLMGDGFMALFNAPTACLDHAQRAVLSAAAMRRAIQRHNRSEQRSLAVRIGIHTGEAIAGNIGAAQLMNYTAIGAAVNLAKRIEERCLPNQILVSVDTGVQLDRSALARERVELRPYGSYQLKGRTDGVELFAVCDNGTESWPS